MTAELNGNIAVAVHSVNKDIKDASLGELKRRLLAMDRLIEELEISKSDNDELYHKINEEKKTFDMMHEKRLGWVRGGSAVVWDALAKSMMTTYPGFTIKRAEYDAEGCIIRGTSSRKIMHLNATYGIVFIQDEDSKNAQINQQND